MRSLLLFAGLLVAAASSRAATETVLDADGDVGSSPAVAIGADGRGLVAYRDATNADLKVAHCADLACTSATLSTMDAAGDVGRFAAIAGARTDEASSVISTRRSRRSRPRTATTSRAAARPSPSSTRRVSRPDVGRHRHRRPGPRLLRAAGGRDHPVAVAHCADAACTTATVSGLPGLVGEGRSTGTTRRRHRCRRPGAGRVRLDRVHARPGGGPGGRPLRGRALHRRDRDPADRRARRSLADRDVRRAPAVAVHRTFRAGARLVPARLLRPPFAAERP